jgi:hypothetical protein
MGLEPSLSVVVGTRIPKETFENAVDVRHPKIIDGMDNNLVAFDGGEYQRNAIIVGQIAYHYNGYGDTDVVMDAVSEYADKRTETKETLEEELGISNREISIYIVGECR